jgi:acetyltransferase-like isoleucine patch superfamily enzyme
MRKLLRQIDELIARRRLFANQQIRIAISAKVIYRQLRIHPGSSLSIGEGSIVEAHLVSERMRAKITIGRDTFIGNSIVSCASQIDIGDDVLISWGCNIVDHNSHPIAWAHRREDVCLWYRGAKNWDHVDTDPVKIGNKSWLGFNVGILKGVEIGEGAIVGAGSIVTKSVLPWTVVAGNPARLIRELSDAER